MGNKVKSLYRYSGGKSRALKFLKPFLEIPHKEYREPFIGGGSIFLFKNKVEKNWINDYDYDVFCAWLAKKECPDKVIEYMTKYTPPTLENWHEVKNNITDELSWRGFRTIFLNRTNFNGMLHLCPIGGMKQTGKWKVDVCWNLDKQIQKIKLIHEKLKDVKITGIDFEEIIKQPGEDVLLVLDPPYILKSENNLYKTGMSLEDHKRLRDLLFETPHNFLLTYKDCKEVRELYKDVGKFILLEKSWTYSMMSQSKGGCQVGNELFILNKNFPLNIEPEQIEEKQIKSKIEIRNLKEGDIFRTEKNNRGQYLKNLGNDKYLLKCLNDGKEYEIFI